MNTDDALYQGSQFTQQSTYSTEPISHHGRANSVEVQVPPLCGLILTWQQD